MNRYYVIVQRKQCWGVQRRDLYGFDEEVRGDQHGGDTWHLKEGKDLRDDSEEEGNESWENILREGRVGSVSDVFRKCL